MKSLDDGVPRPGRLRRVACQSATTMFVLDVGKMLVPFTRNSLQSTSSHLSLDGGTWTFLQLRRHPGGCGPRRRPPVQELPRGRPPRDPRRRLRRLPGTAERRRSGPAQSVPIRRTHRLQLPGHGERDTSRSEPTSGRSRFSRSAADTTRRAE